MTATRRGLWISRGASALVAGLLLLGPTAGPASAAPQHDDDKGQAQAAAQQQESKKPEQTKTKSDNPFLDLGTQRGVGGEDFMDFDRGLIKDQILQFIPPVLQPAFVGHAFVLPPGTFRVALSVRSAKIHGDDFFMAGESNLAGFGDFKVDRQFVDLDLFYGFDLNRRHLHGFT